MKNMFRDRSSDKYAWFCFCLGLAVIFWVFSFQGCKSSMPPINVSFWAGDSAKEGISRAQEKKTIQCKDSEFDQYVCLTYEDLQEIYKLLLECEKWPSDMTLVKTSLLFKKFALKNPEVMLHAYAKPRANYASP